MKKEKDQIAILIPMARPTAAVISVPGSKSLTNRALIIAALSPRTVTVVNPLVADDTCAMADCLTNLGIPIDQKQGRWIVHGGTPYAKNSTRVLNARLSGTTLRFILPLAAMTQGTTVLTGERGLVVRPIGPLVDALCYMGASITFLEKRGGLPIKIRGSALKPGTIHIPGGVSSQFISALLLALPLIGTSKLIIRGQSVSNAYIRMTTDLMKRCGITTTRQENVIWIPQKKYDATRITVEPDVSSACYVAAIAVLAKSTLTVRGINRNSTQPDMRFLTILETMGNSISETRGGLTVRGAGVYPVTVNMTDCPDQIQTLAVLAAFAKGKTVIHGIQTLRLKETDRVHAIQTELRRMRIRTAATQKTLTIWGGDPKNCRIRTYKDHRMAMAFAVAGAKLSGLQIEDPTVVTKTFPNFWDELSAVGITMRRETI